MRPANIEQLAPTLELLATYGAARPADEHLSWLLNVGVAVNEPAGWTVPRSSWLDAAAPADDRVDVLRRTAVRDPGYRAHLDLSIASVLSAIGVAERWKRFEELLQGPLLQFAPRFVQIVEWLERWQGKKCPTFEASIWEKAERTIAGSDIQAFATWDQQLWGVSGNTASLFSLLQDQYVPLLAQPIHFDAAALGLDREAEVLLRSLVEAARRGEGVRATAHHRDAIDTLSRVGVPLRLHEVGSEAAATLIGNVSVSTKMEPAAGFHTYRSIALPDWVLRSCASDPTRDEPTSATFWQYAESGENTTGFISVGQEAKAWPEDRPETPPWAQLPVAATLRGMALTRRESPEVDHALQELSNHLLFGFLLQVLLLEALDRELGEETLVLAPPTDRRVDDIEGATHVLYRPRRTTTDGAVAVRQEAYDLGALDLVFDEFAKAIGIRRIVYAYRGADLGPWSRALRIMRSAELVVGLHDRWSIAPHVLDRLHGGGMMTTVIRRGRQFRERLHSELCVMWTERRNAVSGRAVQHG